jgi:hypothetical protein
MYTRRGNTIKAAAILRIVDTRMTEMMRYIIAICLLEEACMAVMAARVCSINHLNSVSSVLNLQPRMYGIHVPQ